MYVGPDRRPCLKKSFILGLINPDNSIIGRGYGMFSRFLKNILFFMMFILILTIMQNIKAANLLSAAFILLILLDIKH